ncbi:MAG TPA: carboxymuconolactone decarboxylase family protein [Oryzihumus sp.]|nr:carboxymuconolactone decarboxylase family protein [Oryzihumus sp.]
MTRIPLDPPRTVRSRLVDWYGRRQYGQVLDPGRAMAHNGRVLTSTLLHETLVGRWRSLDPTLKALAQMVPAATIGCSWCMDFGAMVSHHEGVAPRKILDIPVWRDSDAYTPLERQVMAFAEAMTQTPPTVTDEMVEGLRVHLSDGQLVELTAMVALENQRSRTNAALGLTSQGFKATCDLERV